MNRFSDRSSILLASIKKADAFGICFFMLASERIELREARAVKQKGPGDLFVSEMRERVLFAWRALKQASKRS